MQIQLRFFASIRETVGTSHEAVTLPPEIATVGQVRQWLRERGGAWAETLAEGRALRMALNQTMCGPDAELVPNAEVAFFPPVTGG